MSYVFAWGLAWIAGSAAYALLDTRRGAGWLAAALGHGLILGMLLAGLTADIFARADTAHALRHAALPLLLFAAAAGAIAWRRVRGNPLAAIPHFIQVEKWKIAVFALTLLSLAWRGGVALREVLLRPTFPWDAWDAWAVKSKTWFLLGHYVPFESMHDWLSAAPGQAYSGVAWSYPTALPWLQVYFASAADGWIEPLVNLPWVALWVGMLLAHYGQWRALGLSAPRALAFVYFFGSLPLLTVHVALAGYADLWVAALFGCAALAWLRWLRDRERGQLILACLCAAALPWIKLEGAVWLLLFALAAGYSLLQRPRRRSVLYAALGIVVFGATIGWLVLPLFGLGWVTVRLTSIDVPVLGTLAIHWHGSALSGMLSSLFAQPNWHLLWWLVPPIVAWRWRVLRTQAGSNFLGALLLCGCAFLALLFLFTDAAQWAESYTAINRLVMHIVPVTITLLALLCRDWDTFLHSSLNAKITKRSSPTALSNSALSDTAPASAPQRDPA